jgi:hypothetical protein
MRGARDFALAAFLSAAHRPQASLKEGQAQCGSGGAKGCARGDVAMAGVKKRFKPPRK